MNDFIRRIGRSIENMERSIFLMEFSISRIHRSMPTMECSIQFFSRLCAKTRRCYFGIRSSLRRGDHSWQDAQGTLIPILSRREGVQEPFYNAVRCHGLTPGDAAVAIVWQVTAHGTGFRHPCRNDGRNDGGGPNRLAELVAL